MYRVNKRQAGKNRQANGQARIYIYERQAYFSIVAQSMSHIYESLDDHL